MWDHSPGSVTIGGGTYYKKGLGDSWIRGLVMYIVYVYK